MIDIKSVTALISALRVESVKDAITPEVVGSLLQQLADLIGTGYSSTEIDELLLALERKQNAKINTYIQQFQVQVGSLRSLIASKQDRLVSGRNIKTINGESVLGSGDINTGNRWK